MRPATLLFYGFATFCLGIIAAGVGAGSLLAGLTGAPVATALSAFLALTIAMSVMFLGLAIVAAFGPKARDREDFE